MRDYLAQTRNFLLTIPSDAAKYRLIKETDMSGHEKRHRENPEAPVTNIVTYVPKAGKEAELLALVKSHEPALRAAGLCTKEPFKVWKAFDIRKGRTSYIEWFQWKDG